MAAGIQKAKIAIALLVEVLMINVPYKFARERKAKESRAQKRQFIVAGVALFVLYAIVSTMEYNDCIRGVVC